MRAQRTIAGSSILHQQAEQDHPRGDEHDLVAAVERAPATAPADGQRDREGHRAAHAAKVLSTRDRARTPRGGRGPLRRRTAR
jgi:hypothetical protein